MPKEKQRTQSRRAASKEALKQMHLLLGDEKKYEISSEDDDVIEVEVQPPKKKYKLSHRKSSDGNDRDVIVLKTVEESPFDLEVVVEELTPCQKSRFAHQKKEVQEVDAKIDKLLNTPNSEVIYNGVYTTAVEISEQIQSIISKQTTAIPTTYTLPSQTTTLPAATTVQQPVASQGIVLQQQQTPGTMPQSYQLVMDPRLGVIVGTVANTGSNTPPLQLYQPKVTMAAAAAAPAANNEQPTMKTRRATMMRQMPAALHKTTLVTQKNSPVTKQNKTLQVKQNLMSKNVQGKTKTVAAATTQKAILPMKGRPPNSTPNSSTFRPTENSVEGGLSMGKPTKSIDLTSEDGRALPDSREVSFNKLQGRTYPSLVVVARPHLRVKDLASDRAKLDVKVKSVLMYPPTKFTEWLIQQGLVRSDQKCSIHSNNPLKLGMYSDASKFPYSGGYVWISECCPQRFVSVFSGSLFEGSQHPPMSILKLLYHWCCQTIVQNVTQWVKVDNLYVKGMYTWLRSVCTVALDTHIKQLGGPGVRVQVGVISLGTTSQDGNKREVKVEVLGILETTTRHIRLRAVEPLADGERNYKKRFNKILEPVFNWVHPSSIIVTDLTVDKATLHQMGFLQVVQGTSTEYANSNRTIMEYLRRIVPRMFQNTLSLLSRQIIQQFLDELVWREWYGTTVLQCFDNMVQHLSEQTRHDSGPSLVARLNKVSANPFKKWAIPIAGPSSSGPAKIELQVPKRYSRQRKPATPQPQPQVLQDVVRPAKSTSPDVPEQMVPLENYYYGSITPPQELKSKVTINIKCPFCKLTFNTNISLMNHLFKHAHNVSNDIQLCKYCLMIVPTGNDLLKHINTSHPDETKFDNSFVCLICECHFKNPFILGKHMSKEHCPSELPYLCGTCGFRCSNHKQAVDHFYQLHDHGTTIQCPFCLKSTTIYSGGRNISQNMNYFIQHLQKHQKKQLAKRCGRCTLWFIQKEFLKDHQAKMHVSQRGKRGLIPCFAPRNGVMVPKSRMDKCPDDGKVINFSTLYFNAGKNLDCKECAKPLSSPKHFASFESCQNLNCQYSTCCTNAMQEHVVKCKSLHENIPAEKLPFEMFCICGYRDIFGNQMAKHLAICERKSAYPSRQAAKGATVTQCMLDVLGLVRKPDETKRSEGNSSTTPIILKHRGRPRKYPGLMKTSEVGEIKDNNGEKSDMQINISDIRGAVDSTDVKTEKSSAEEVDLIQKDEDADDSNKSEKEKETTVINEEKPFSDKEESEDIEMTDKSRLTDDENDITIVENEVNTENPESEEANEGKSEETEKVETEVDAETTVAIVTENKENEVPEESKEDATSEETTEKLVSSEEKEEIETPVQEKETDNLTEKKDAIPEIQDPPEETTTDETLVEKKTTDEEVESEVGNEESDQIESEVTTAEEQESEVSQDGVVASEEKDVVASEEKEVKDEARTEISLNEITDTSVQIPDKVEENEKMEVDFNTETFDKVAIESETSENINICPMDTD